MTLTECLSPRKPITINQLDRKLPEELIAAGVERIRECIQCGTCTASCPSGRRTAYRTRLIMRKALLGLKEDLLKSLDLWLCTTCYTCYERCPRKISVVETIIALRNMAAAKGFMLPRHKEISKYLIDYGHFVPINDANKKRRIEVGLSELPPTVHSYPEALEEVKKLFEITGFKKLVEG
ncbi:MAG: CoB--CoM heterodisulfide reductase subunit C [Candidatus Nezhaarchaeales archaeon]